MAEIFEYVPHPHAEERKIAGPPTVAAAVVQLHGPGPVGRFNARFGFKITVIVGQNVQAAAADARAEATYKDAAAVLEEAKQIQAHLTAQDAEIGKIVAALITPRAG